MHTKQYWNIRLWWNRGREGNVSHHHVRESQPEVSVCYRDKYRTTSAMQIVFARDP